jgi:hypothetical protein
MIGRYPARRKERSMTFAGMFTALLIISLALTGCASTIPATITVYHTLPDNAALTRYTFVPLKDQETGIENAEYRNAIRQELIRYHYLESDAPNARLLISFSYGINEGRERPEPGIFGSASYTEYRKGLWIFMYENTPEGRGEQKIVYEGSVVSAGSLMEVSTAMPAMIRALFQEFPGESGRTRKVLIESRSER